MRKELFFAILLGLTAGLIITYGLYRARTSLQTTPVLQTSETPIPTPAIATNLIITSPDDETIQESKTVTVAGTTDPNAFVVVVTTDTDQVTQADASGNFSVETQLSDGANVIIVYGVNEDGQVTSQERTVTVESATPEATESSETPEETPDES